MVISVGQDSSLVIKSDNPHVVEGRKATRIQCAVKEGAGNAENIKWYGPSGSLIGSAMARYVYNYNYNNSEFPKSIGLTGKTDKKSKCPIKKIWCSTG
jgi:hypothetical protein